MYVRHCSLSHCLLSNGDVDPLAVRLQQLLAFSRHVCLYQLGNPTWLGLQIINAYLYPTLVMCC